MVSRFRIAWLTAVLAVALVAATTSVAAARPTVRLPTSAADWATFTQAEKDATMKWVWAQKDRMVADGTWTWTDATGTAASGADASRLAAAVAVTGSVSCGIKTNQQPWGTYATGWASTSASSPVYYVSTGLTGIENKLWHNDTVFSHGWGSGRAGTYTYAESAQDFKFNWDSVTWHVQTWGSVHLSASTYLFKNKFCEKTVVG